MNTNFEPWRKSAGRTAGALACFILVTACGSEQGATDVPVAKNSAANSGKENARSNSMVNAFEFTVSGDVQVSAGPSPSEITLAGGCTRTSPLSIGFLHGSPITDGYFYFTFDSVDRVTSGQTGDVALSKITWDNGLMTPASLPAGSNIKGPVRYSGEGSLTVKSQTGVGLGGRMTGVVEGVVTNADSQKTATVSASFDINLACAA